VKLGARRPLTSFNVGAACLFRRLTLEPARWVPRIAAASACHRILILPWALRAARPFQHQGREVAMDIVHPRVAGIDVHKKVIWVAVRLPGQEAGQRAVTVRRFKAFWRSLHKMAGWLVELGGRYWDRTSDLLGVN
jgi:hypothetical protein